VPLVEDGFEEELKYFGKCALPIKSMDTGGAVVYLGTFSKVVFPGLRVGWVAAERACIERLLAISRFSALSANVVAQAALQRFCAAGCYEALLRRVHRAYRRRMLALLAALRRHLPERGVRWTQPAGGYTLWLTVERTAASEERVDAQLRAHGVVASRGSLYFASPHRGVHFRISIANLDEGEIEEGCRRLGAALASVVEG
jgi:DNA-binding transcriptional MocR family regulator